MNESMSMSTAGPAVAAHRPLLLNYRGAAKALGIGQRTLADMVKAGEIPVVRIRARVLFCPDSLAAWAKSQER